MSLYFLFKYLGLRSLRSYIVCYWIIIIDSFMILTSTEYPVDSLYVYEVLCIQLTVTEKKSMNVTQCKYNLMVLFLSVLFCIRSKTLW